MGHIDGKKVIEQELVPPHTPPPAIEMGEDDGVINQQSIDQFVELPMETIKKDVYAMDITSLRRLLLEAVQEIKEYEKTIDIHTERFQFFAQEQEKDRRKIEELEKRLKEKKYE
jgi:phage shock protein A